MAGSLDSRKAWEWRRRMARFEETQQSVVKFCRQEGVSAPSFYHWRKRLAQQARPAEEAADFRPVRVIGSAEVSVRLPGGTQLHVPTSDPQALRLVIETLARLDAQRTGGGPC
jgi:transposase-like protein